VHSHLWVIGLAPLLLQDDQLLQHIAMVFYLLDGAQGDRVVTAAPF
jgi:hypothetical protein